MNRRIIGALALMIGSAMAGFADHLPDNLLAHGRPETNLAGINLKNTNIRKIIRLYGQPTEVKKEEPTLPNSAGSFQYYWRKRGLDLHVEAFFLPGKPNWQPIVLVEIGVGTSQRAGRTGAGLHIGSTLADLKRLYGRRFHLRNIPTRDIHDVMLQWRQQEYSLVATLDRKDRVTSISLFAPE